MDRRQFKKRVVVRSPIDVVYRAFATSRGLESWFLRKAEFTSRSGKIRRAEEGIENGDVYEWFWHGWPDEVAERKKILETNGKDIIRFTFSGDSVVSVSIKQYKAVTVVELVQQIPEGNDPDLELRIGCDTGWTFYLTNLKSVLEGGLDLRNKDVLQKDVVNA